MKHLEVSKKIILTKDVSEDDLKKALQDKLSKAFDIDSLSDDESSLSFYGATSGYDGITRHAQIKLNIKISKQNEIVRIILTGRSKMARSLLITYSLLTFVILMVGLLPGSIETSAEGSGALDALVFLIFGIFISYDINQKIEEPRSILIDILNGLDTEFG